MRLTEKIAKVLATGFFIGMIPFAPGTFGTLLGLLPVLLVSQAAPPVALVIIIAVCLLSVWITHTAARAMEQEDPGCIVLDEIAGIMAALWGLPFAPVPVAAGFVIFRTLDILKPFPIRQLEKKLSGGAGIVADDVAAGIMANVVLRVAMAVI